MKTIQILALILSLSASSFLNAQAVNSTKSSLAEIGNEVRSALAMPISLKVPTSLVEKPNCDFWSHPALKGQTGKWTISVPTHVLLTWMAKTDGLADSEKKAIGEMAKKANFSVLAHSLSDSAKKSGQISGDGKAFSEAIARLCLVLDEVKANGLSRAQSDAINHFFQVMNRPAIKG